MLVSALEADFRIGFYGRVCLLSWSHAATTSGIERNQAVLESWLRRGGRDFAQLVHIPPSARTPPSEATRAAMNRCMAALSPHVRCLVMVYEGSGFVAATIRSVVSARHLLQRSSLPVTVVDHAGAAARFINRHLGDTHYGEAELDSALNGLLAATAPHGP